jgi:hypothetical protein
MSINILIGRAGEDLHRFTLEDIKRGAVRESGLFPEIYKSKWPVMTAAVLVSGVDRKLQEHRTALRYGEYDIPLWLPSSVLSEALEDSKEAEKNQNEIAAGKLDRGFVGPIRRQLRIRKPEDVKLFGRHIAHRAGVHGLDRILCFADDRNMILDPMYLTPLYGSLRNHWNPQVHQIFEPGHDVPGERVKEVDSAQYGVPNSIYKMQTAREILRKRASANSQYCRMDTTLFIQSLIPGALPIPEEGLIIKAEGIPFVRKGWRARDAKAMHDGKIFTYDHFNEVAAGYGLPRGMTLYDLKQDMPLHPYLAEVHSPGAAMTAMAHILRFPKESGARKGRPRYSSQGKPKTIVTNANVMTQPPGRRDVLSHLSLPQGLRLSGENGSLNSLRRLEMMAYSGQAFVVLDPERFAAKTDNGLSARDAALLRNLETDLIYAYLITMSTQAGAPNHIGRAHMIEKSYWEKRGKWHPDMCNMGLTGDTETEAYRVFENAQQLEEGLNQWNQSTYQHAVRTPQNDFVNEAHMKLITGVEDFGFVIGGYGSASSFIDKAYKDACSLFYRMSRYQGVTTIDGGGVRSAMLGMKEGVLAALEQGYNVRNIGVRSETDVSPLEGNVEDWIRERGYKPQRGEDERHLHFANGQMHVVQLRRLLQRQTPIAALAHVSAFFPGGKGTVVEACITRLHNARVKLLGEGLFPGYASNNRTIPMLYIDHEFNYLGKRRHVFDKLLQMDRAHYSLLDIHIFRDNHRIEKAEEFIRLYAAMLGYDLHLQRPGSKTRPARSGPAPHPALDAA